MGHLNTNIEDIGTEGDLNCRSLAQELSEENNINMCSRDCFCDILVKNVTLCSYLKSMLRAKGKVKKIRLTALTQKKSEKNPA